ncbi:MAG: glycosyltransferase [Caldilineaceae bacterium]
MQTVVHFTDSRDFGGAEQALLHLLSGLDRQRWRPVLFHHAEDGIAPLLQGVRQLEIESQVVPPMPLGRNGIRAIPSFMRTLRQVQPALFHAHLTWPLACKYGLVGAILARTPAVVATAQLFIDLPYDRSTRLQQRLLAVGVGRYLAVSQALAQRLRQTFQIPAHKVQVVHNAIPLAAYTQPANRTLRAELTGGNDCPVILTAARLDPQKGLSYLLEAAVQIPEALFVVAGEGALRPQLEAQRRALGLEERLVFLGRRTDIPELLAACDLFVLPSIYEGLPLALLEAMAAGKTVISTAIEGTCEAVAHNQTGWLVPPADSIALAGAIRRLLADQPLRQRLAAAGQARVQQDFSVCAMVQQVQQVYTTLLGGEKFIEQGQVR